MESIGCPLERSSYIDFVAKGRFLVVVEEARDCGRVLKGWKVGEV